MIPIDRIVGSVDKVRNFDPIPPAQRRQQAAFGAHPEAAGAGNRCRRSTSTRSVGLYSVRTVTTGVGVRALGLDVIEADVRQVETLVEPDDVHAHSDLSDQELRRLLMQRVPMSKTAGRTFVLSDRSSIRRSPDDDGLGGPA